MSLTRNFEQLIANLAVDNKTIIDMRCNSITKRLNIDYWGVDSDSKHCKYVGSFGRGTAIKDFHDVDMLFVLPDSIYERYDGYAHNGQSSLLQAVKTSIRKTYPSTDIGGDGQVVTVSFYDGMRIEVLPAFSNCGWYVHPDSNNGGSWSSTEPDSEIRIIKALDKAFGGELTDLCKMARAWRREWDAEIKGILLDTLACDFLIHSTWSFWGSLCYDYLFRDFLSYVAEQDPKQNSWVSVGTGSPISRTGAFEAKAKRCVALADEAISDDEDNMQISACSGWRDIFGDYFPVSPL